MDDLFKRRGSIDIVATILDASRRGATKTMIVYACKINFVLANKYLKWMIQRGLLSECKDKEYAYKTTNRGAEFFSLYQKLKEKTENQENPLKKKSEVEKQPELALEKTLEEVLNVFSEAVMAVDLTGVIRLANATALSFFGYTTEEAIGKHFCEISQLKTEEILRYLKMLDSFYRGEKNSAFNVHIHDKNGNVRLVEVNFSGLNSKQGQKKKFLMILKNLNDREQTIA